MWYSVVLYSFNTSCSSVPERAIGNRRVVKMTSQRQTINGANTSVGLLIRQHGYRHVTLSSAEDKSTLPLHEHTDVSQCGQMYSL